jgi:hypothetical protein
MNYELTRVNGLHADTLNPAWAEAAWQASYENDAIPRDDKLDTFLVASYGCAF